VAHRPVVGATAFLNLGHKELSWAIATYHRD
jgi:hypothetical protein